MVRKKQREVIEEVKQNGFDRSNEIQTFSLGKGEEERKVPQMASVFSSIRKKRTTKKVSNTCTKKIHMVMF